MNLQCVPVVLIGLTLFNMGCQPKYVQRAKSPVHQEMDRQNKKVQDDLDAIHHQIAAGDPAELVYSKEHKASDQIIAKLGTLSADPGFKSLPQTDRKKRMDEIIAKGQEAKTRMRQSHYKIDFAPDW